MKLESIFILKIYSGLCYLSCGWIFQHYPMLPGIVLALLGTNLHGDFLAYLQKHARLASRLPSSAQEGKAVSFAYRESSQKWRSGPFARQKVWACGGRAAK